MSSTHVQGGFSMPLAGAVLLSMLAENWWLLLLRCVTAIVFGAIAFLWRQRKHVRHSAFAEADDLRVDLGLSVEQHQPAELSRRIDYYRPFRRIARRLTK